MTRPTILIAGGGTGGHVFPAIAVAAAMQAVADVDVVFCGTARGVESRVVPARGYRLELLEIDPMKGGGPIRMMRGAAVALRATAPALRLVRALRPRAVLCVGGYASGPVTLVAAILGVPIAVLEPNRTVGLANRIVAPFARRAYLAWEEAAGTFRAGTSRLFGVPLRPGFSPRPPASLGSVRVLVMGGSQGAAVLNDRMPEVIARLAARVPAVEVLHQAGRDRDDPVRSTYSRLNCERVTVVPFIEDVARAIADADVVVARAGAVTIAEITAIGRAAILVPFPLAADDHQAKNAEALARAGAAVSLRQPVADVGRLATEIERLLGDDVARAAMADASRTRGRPDAARRVADDLLDLASIGERPQDRAHAADVASPHRVCPGRRI